MNHYDVVIIGTGAGGGTLARHLAPSEHRGLDRDSDGPELVTFNVAYSLLIGLNALIGTVWVVLAWRRYGRVAAAEERPVAA
jgi:glycine/D-amino acid oxidase-like deaminating enzyme